MRLDEAWTATQHGGSMSRPSGARIEKWMGEKPDQKPSFSRWLEKNLTTTDITDLMAGDWYVNP